GSGGGGGGRGCNLPSFPRDSSSFWIWFSRKNMATLSAYGADLSSEACRELGFSSNLLCSSCDLLGEFSLTKLQPNCRQCCQQEAQMEARKLYAGAILEVFQGEFYCFDFTYYLYVRGSDPVLKLLDDNGNIAEELSILKWNTDSVEEFLSEKLDRI
uniref:Selenoprotein F n=1 Tax=Amphiprion percula TaxID=161767 RepID=A0A3P8T3A2_AMPPE